MVRFEKFSQEEKQQHYSEVPDSQRHKFTYSLAQTDNWGNPTTSVLSFTKNTVELAGKKLALSYSPATEDDQAIIESFLPEPDPITGEIDPSQLPDTLWWDYPSCRFARGVIDGCP